MAVQYSEYSEMMNLTPNNRSMAGNTCLHCGKRVRLPIITYSRMLLPNEASTAACPADCNTVQINPNAMSSLEASALALPKSEATASMGSPGNG